MKHRHEHYHNTNINEHRAPTDESIRLFSEMEKKAMDSILATIEVKSTLIEGIVVFARADQCFEASEVFVKFNVNGTRFDIAIKITMSEIMNIGYEQMAIKLLEAKFSDAMAHMFTQEAMRSHARTIFSR
jgi:hypothetical protein